MIRSDFRQLLAERISIAGLVVDSSLLESLQVYFELLRRWNSRINLTGFDLDRPTASAIDRLLVEPLQLAALIAKRVSIWVDLGSGGGSPALPLHLYRPALSLHLVESKHRKVAFLNEAVRALQLDNVQVEPSRIEDISTGHRLAGTADLITMRAVRPAAAVFAAMEALLAQSGRAVIMGSSRAALAAPVSLEVVESSRLATVLARNGSRSLCST